MAENLFCMHAVARHILLHCTWCSHAAAHLKVPGVMITAIHAQYEHTIQLLSADDN